MGNRYTKCSHSIVCTFQLCIPNTNHRNLWHLHYKCIRTNWWHQRGNLLMLDMGYRSRYPQLQPQGSMFQKHRGHMGNPSPRPLSKSLRDIQGNSPLRSKSYIRLASMRCNQSRCDRSNPCCKDIPKVPATQTSSRSLEGKTSKSRSLLTVLQ